MNLLEYEPIKKFIDTLGKDIEKYFGKDDACIVYLRPDGIFYAQGLYQWFLPKKKNLVITTMDDDGGGLEEEKVRGRKVLIVDTDVVTGKAYKRSTEGLRLRKKELQIRDVKFATFIDRVGLADFFVWKYSPESIWHFDEMNVLDLKIIAQLAENGREPFANMGKDINLSAVTVKNRVDKLLREKVITIEAQLRADQFYTMCAQIFLEADAATVDMLIEKCERRQEVYHLVRVTGIYNLGIGILAHNWHAIEEFIEREIRAEKGVRKIFIITGGLPLAPKTIPPKIL
ncbi:MAG: Lrp/AsnC family transcriptional regulator [Patescibacteria group bacterium]